MLFLILNEYKSYFLSIPYLPLDVKERNTLDIAKKEKKGYNVTKSREVWNEETK